MIVLGFVSVFSGRENLKTIFGNAPEMPLSRAGKPSHI